MTAICSTSSSLMSRHPIVSWGVTNSVTFRVTENIPFEHGTVLQRFRDRAAMLHLRAEIHFPPLRGLLNGSAAAVPDGSVGDDDGVLSEPIHHPALEIRSEEHTSELQSHL